MGAEVKVLYKYGSVQDLDSLLEHIKKCILRGEKARFIEKLPLKMYVLDRKYVLMALENKKTENSSLTTIVVEHSGLGKATPYCSTTFGMDFFFRQFELLTVSDTKL